MQKRYIIIGYLKFRAGSIKKASTESISRNSDHNKYFELEVVIEDRHFPSAWGSNKKEAEQKAAYNALVELKVLEKTAENSG